MNIKEFFKGPQQYTTQEPTDPCEYGRSVWDKREGAVIVQNHNLRLLTLALAGACVVLAGGLVFQSMKSTIEPYVIEVDRSTGEVKSAGVMSEIQYTPQNEEIEYFIGQFILNTRSLPLDPVVYKQNWSEAYHFLTRDAATKMSAEIKQDKIAENFGKQTVQVSIVSILPVDGSSGSYQARWNEEVFIVGSGEKEVIPMTGVFTTMTIPAKDKETLRVNPLGIYLSDFNWQKDTTVQNTKK